MMELKEGMYLRTKKGEIHRIKSINEEYIEYENDFGVPYDLKDYYIVKANNKIIELIEEKDYVNGSKVLGFMYDSEKSIKEGIDEKIGVVVEGEWNTIKYLIEDIKSIVTKEQFESISYRVEE